MNEDISIVRMDPMRVASIRSVCETPEETGWEIVRAWVAKRGLPGGRRVFGFDSPPYGEQGSPVRGYEYWVEMGPEEMVELPMQPVNFGGGLYAVLRVAVDGRPWETIPPGWQRLEAWLRENPTYDLGEHQAFEEPEIPGAPLSEMVLRLYCPLKEKNS